MICVVNVYVVFCMTGFGEGEKEQESEKDVSYM